MTIKRHCGIILTENMLFSLSGDWLGGSDWITTLTNIGICTSGKAQSHLQNLVQVHTTGISSRFVHAYEKG